MRIFRIGWTYVTINLHPIKGEKTLEDSGTIYKKVVTIIFIAAMLAHVILAARLCIKGDCYFEVISGLIIFGGILSLITTLTYVKITLWGIGRPLFSAYPLVLLYSGLMIVLFFSGLFRKDSITHENRW